MAATTASASGSLSATLAQAIIYLTRSLVPHYPATTVIALQLSLEANLTAQFASSWVPTEPLRGSGRRCLTLSPNGLPPRPIYNACKSAGVEWSRWAALLGGLEFDLFVDPGCVSVRFGNWDLGKARFFTVWSEQLAAEVKSKKQSEETIQAELKAQAEARAAVSKKTLAQQLIEEDKVEDDELFAMIADKVREPSWLAPMLNQFPDVPTPERSASSSPVSISSEDSVHSRSSSRSSTSSSGFSFFSAGSAGSYGSATTVSLSPADESPKFKLSRRERARQARVFIDSTKKEVTNYDGGKTTVLTGGVMLGGGPVVVAKPVPVIAAPTVFSKKISSAASTNWRSIRA